MDMHVMRQSNAAMKAKETEEVAVCVSPLPSAVADA
jgi:hypothetical protein